jgi:hypothetical protein
MTRLFVHLVRISNFRTGAGSTTFAQLVIMLTPLQPRSGPRYYVPDAQAVRKAVVGFEERRILARDQTRRDGTQFLFFMVLDRGAQARPMPKLEGGTRTPVDNGKARAGAALPQ